MTRRHDARRRAALILFQADVARRPLAEVLEERRGVGERIPRFTAELLDGVEERREELDRVIAAHTGREGWPIERLAAVDRALLRIAVYEILFRDDIPDGVTIVEAVEAAKELSTEDSGRFVNGVLGRIAGERASAGQEQGRPNG